MLNVHDLVMFHKKEWPDEGPDSPEVWGSKRDLYCKRCGRLAELYDWDRLVWLCDNCHWLLERYYQSHKESQHVE